MYRYTLEKYSGTKSRHTCPGCGQKRKFTRYVDTQTGHYLANDVGICDRKANCGYHYPPKEYFRDNPTDKEERRYERIRLPLRTAIVENKERAGFDTIKKELFLETLSRSTPNNFLDFLETRFDADKVQLTAKQYAIGTWKDGRTVFWQVDSFFRIRTGKLMTYDPATGKRRKDRAPSWVHAEIKKQSARSGSVVNANFRLKQCFFGEHLLSRFPERPIAVVESEKTAVIASLFFQEYAWIATGGCANLRLAPLTRLAGERGITLFPDTTQFEKWSKQVAQQTRRSGSIRVSDLLEKKLNSEQKTRDMDLADLILELMPGTDALAK